LSKKQTKKSTCLAGIVAFEADGLAGFPFALNHFPFLIPRHLFSHFKNNLISRASPLYPFNNQTLCIYSLVEFISSFATRSGESRVPPKWVSTPAYCRHRWATAAAAHNQPGWEPQRQSCWSQR